MIHHLTTKEVAQELQISPRRVQALIKAGRLPAVRLGRDWFINPADLSLIIGRKPGRPRTKNVLAA
jgi:excisionase family DNA binding protein